MASTAANGASRLGLWLSIAISAGLLFGMIGTVFYVGFRVQATADALDLLVRRTAVIEDKIAILQDRLTRMETSQTEIETQFCGVARDVNRMHANDMRVFALLWHKSFGDTYPTDNSYYPEYGRCGNTKAH
jgi:hypothetical protein